jgi:Heparinase II/III-like protein
MRLIALVVFFLVALALNGQTKRNLLSTKYSEEFLKTVLTEPQKWFAEPGYPTRDRWNETTTNRSEAILKRAEKYLNYDWRAISASSFLAFDAIGNRDSMQQIDVERKDALYALVEAELLEAKGRFLNKIIDGVWSECEETFWGYSAHVNRQKQPGSLPDVKEPIIDLFASEKGAKLARIYYLMQHKFDSVNPLISERIRYEINRRILEPYYTRNDFSWFGFDDGFVNNWNPWINSNVLSTILLMVEDPAKRAQGAYKAMRSMDKYINFVKADGWCDEGPSYWGVAGARLFWSLEMLYQSSNGKINVFDQEIIHNLGKYIYNAYIADDYYVNFADAAAKNTHDPEMIFKWGEYSNDAKMMGFAAFLAKKRGHTSDKKLNEYPAWEPLQKSFWFPDNQIAGGRDSETSSNGFYLVAKGGHNEESHNHNDVGTCIVHFNNKPILIDAGKLYYTKYSFGDKRYTYWPTRSNYHNVPTINGIEQHVGKEYAAKSVKFISNDRMLQFSLDIAKAYPEEAKVDLWNRTYTLNRGKSLVIQDRYKLTEVKGENYLNFLTCCKASILKPGVVRLQTEGISVDISFDNKALTPIIEEFDTNDKTVEVSWGKKLTRLRFKILSVKQENKIELTFKGTKI